MFPESVIRSSEVRMSEETLRDLSPLLCSSVPTSSLSIPPDLLTTLRARPEIQSALQVLDQGAAFLLIKLPEDTWNSNDEMVRLSWLISSIIGRPVTQAKEPTYIFDVMDCGASISQGARFSQTNHTTGFHTDGSWSSESLDYISLLCLKKAMSGGITQLISGYSVVDLLRQNHPHAFAVLSKPFYFHKRGGLAPNEPPVSEFPVVSYDPSADCLQLKFLRTWIDIGHEIMSQPLTTEQVAAIDLLESLIHSSGLLAEFFLERGDLILYNNHSVLHNRTFFQDDPDPANKRHLVRFWMTARKE